MVNKKLEEILRSSIWVDNLSEEAKSEIRLECLYIINTGEKYNGDFGKNGYNNILLVGRSISKDNYYVISDRNVDSILLWQVRSPLITIDIPSDLNCIRIFGFKEPLSVLSISDSISLTNTKKEEGGTKQC